MAKIEVILTSNIVGLGAESDQVQVAAGYARNYLLPQGLAIPLTQANKRRLEVLRQRRAEREAHDLNSMTELAKSLQKLICVLKVKTGDDGKMFGTVTSGMIADELKTQFDVSLDKRKIHLEHPIRNLGDCDVELHLHADVKSTLKVRVESITPPPAPAEVSASDARREGPRTEKRGRRFERTETTGVGDRRPRQDGADKAPPTGKAATSEKPARAERAPKTEKPAKAEKSE
jgi:large subunit ribosomal protein L9